MRLHLVRHGRTDWNHARRVQGQLDSRLDEVGRQQARELGTRLRGVPFAALHVSTSERTRETAALAFAGRDLPTTFHEDLREMRLGRWEGLMWADVERDEPDATARYYAYDEAMSVEGAEGFAELQARGLSIVGRIVEHERAAGHDDADIAVVSHGALLRTVLARWLDVPLPRFEPYPPLPNCAHSLVRVEGSDFHVETIADAPLRESLWGELLA